MLPRAAAKAPSTPRQAHPSGVVHRTPPPSSPPRAKMGVAEMIAKAKAREEAAKKEKAAANTPKSPGNPRHLATEWPPAAPRRRPPNRRRKAPPPMPTHRRTHQASLDRERGAAADADASADRIRWPTTTDADAPPHGQRRPAADAHGDHTKDAARRLHSRTPRDADERQGRREAGASPKTSGGIRARLAKLGGGIPMPGLGAAAPTSYAIIKPC